MAVANLVGVTFGNKKSNRSKELTVIGLHGGLQGSLINSVLIRELLEFESDDMIHIHSYRNTAAIVFAGVKLFAVV